MCMYGNDDKKGTRRCGPRAFSLLEVLVVIALVLLILSLVLVSMRESRRSAQSGKCLSQVRQITIGLRQYGVTHRHLPDPVVSGVSWARSIEPYLSSRSIFVCPGDNEVVRLTGISYDWRDTGEPSTTMAGKALDKTLRGDAVLVFESLPGWHVERKINTGWIDGSVRMMDDAAAFADLHKPVRAVDEP